MTLPDTRTHPEDTRFGRLVERQDDDDFPYYDGKPVEIATWKWLCIIASCVVAFVALMMLPEDDNISAPLPRILFPAIMLAVFIGLTGRYWTAIFRRLRLRDVWTILGFLLFDMAVTFGVALVVRRFFGASGNTASEGLGEAGTADTVAFYVGTALQTSARSSSRSSPCSPSSTAAPQGPTEPQDGVVVASLLSAVWFGAAHLPTYDWNFAQCFLIIGIAVSSSTSPTTAPRTSSSRPVHMSSTTGSSSPS